MPITPNQITLFKAFLAVVGALCLYFWSYRFAGALLLLMTLLDHVDGQLARLKHLSSTFGKALDDMSDYIMFSAYYVAASLALARDMGSAKFFFPVALAGLSSLLHTVVFDNCLHDYADEAAAEETELDRERDKYTALLQETPRLLPKLAYAIYLFHLNAQLRTQTDTTHRYVTARYVRFMSFLGPMTNMTLFAVFLLFEKLGLHFFIIGILFNLYLGVLLLLRKPMNQATSTGKTDDISN